MNMLHKRQDKHFIFCTFGDSSKSRKTFPFIHHQSSNAHVPKAPHRRLRNDTPTALGVGRASIRIPLLVEKPIVRSPRPSEFNERLRADTAHTLNRSKSLMNSLTEPLLSLYCDEQVHRLSEKRLYTSTTREATEEAALPTPRRIVPHSTLEREADPVRYRVIRYSPRPSLWQHYAREWDAMQLRRSPDADSLTLPEIGKNCSSLFKNSGASENLDEVKSKELVFFRPMPGYGGFVPRHAVEQSSHKDTDCITDCMCSTAVRTYRTFAVNEYKLLEHARKGPFSKTVTMTHPLNPFNKVERKTHSY